MREIKVRWYDHGYEKMLGPFNIQTLALKPHLILDEDIVMEYTGLKDKNGKEIYEGDIINIWHIHDVEEGSEHVAGTEYIAWREPSAALVLRSDPDNTDHPIDIAGEPDYFLEVIGNIYENPELLP